MSDARYFISPARSVLTVSGEDRASFLQGLISNDTARISPSAAIYSAFLTPQGKYLYDFTIAARLDATGAEIYLLDVEAARRVELQKRLSMYRLRSKVVLADGGVDWVVAVIYGVRGLEALSLPAQAGAAKAFEGGVVFVDPRLPALGARAILPATTAATLLQAAGLHPGDAAAYDRLRLSLGIPESPVDLVPDKSILLESGFDELHGVDWQKGCYMGQELTARTKYRGLVRKRLLPVTITGTPPAPGTPIMAGEREVGEMRSHASDGSVGIAMLRLEALEALRSGGSVTLQAGDTTLVPHLPEWVRLPPPEAATA